MGQPEYRADSAATLFQLDNGQATARATYERATEYSVGRLANIMTLNMTGSGLNRGA
jgi:hypothetical protein